MIRPTRLTIAVGGEHLLPVAKHALQALRTQMERMKVKTLSRILDVGEGRISIVCNDFGIDSINIAWAGLTPHGIVCRPASDEAVLGWGKPFTDDKGNKINPPLGSILTAKPFHGDDKQREVLFYRNSYESPVPSPAPETKIKRRFTNSGSFLRYTGQKIAWFSKDRKTVLTSEGEYVYSRGNAIAGRGFNSADDIGVIRTIGKFSEARSGGTKQPYLWVATGKEYATGKYHELKFYRTEHKKKRLTSTDKTVWELLGGVNIKTELSALGVLDANIAIGRVVTNESCTESMCVYNGEGMVNGEKKQVSGYVVIERTPFSFSLHQNDDTASISVVDRSQSSWQAYLSGVPPADKLVFDVGYRGDRQVFAKVTDISFMFDYDSTTDQKLSAKRKMVVSFDGKEVVLDDSVINAVHTKVSTDYPEGYIDKYTRDESFSSLKRKIVDAKPSDGFFMYIESPKTDGTVTAELTDTVRQIGVGGYELDTSVGHRTENHSGATVKTIVQLLNETVDLELPNNLRSEGGESRVTIDHKWAEQPCNPYRDRNLPVVENENRRNLILGTDCSLLFDFYYSLGARTTYPYYSLAPWVDHVDLPTASVRRPNKPKAGPYIIPFPNYLYRGIQEVYLANHAHFPIDDKNGIDCFSIPVSDEMEGNSTDGYSKTPKLVHPHLDLAMIEDNSPDLRWVNYLSEDDPVTLSKVTGQRPRFNNITVF